MTAARPVGIPGQSEDDSELLETSIADGQQPALQVVDLGYQFEHGAARVIIITSATSASGIVVHDSKWEWVYNDADIDHGKVAWARDVAAAQNQELLYFKYRHVCLVDADDTHRTPVPYITGNVSALAAGESAGGSDPP